MMICTEHTPMKTDLTMMTSTTSAFRRAASRAASFTASFVVAVVVVAAGGARVASAQGSGQAAPAPGTPSASAPAQSGGGPAQKEMAAAMEKARRFTQPGEAHKALGRFAGKWSTEMRFFMMGKPTPPEKGTAEFAWLMPGRWMKGEMSGSLMGNPAKWFTLIGYDNFKQSYVTTNVSTMDTAMTHAEGDMDPGGAVLIMYGTLDEYLTGEHDKMVKYVWRFASPDRIVMEVHDLPIGETNTKVLEMTYVRSGS